MNLSVPQFVKGKKKLSGRTKNVADKKSTRCSADIHLKSFKHVDQSNETRMRKISNCWSYIRVYTHIHCCFSCLSLIDSCTPVIVGILTDSTLKKREALTDGESIF